MKNKLFAAVLIVLLGVVGCTKDVPIRGPQFTDYTTNYKYFPLDSGYVWEYDYLEFTTITNATKTADYQLVFDNETKRVDHFKNGNAIAWSGWYNTNNQLQTWAGKILIDYSLVSSNSKDSVLIESQEASSNSPKIETYQYAGVVYQNYASNYASTPAIRTTQINTWMEGDKLIIERYYGFDVGLLYEKESTLGINGKVESYNRITLKEHRF